MKKYEELTKNELDKAREIHDKSIVIDAINVTFLYGLNEEYVSKYQKGGLTSVANVISKRYDTLMQVYKLLVGYRKRFEQMKNKVILTLKAKDIIRAKKEGKLAVTLALDFWHPSLAIDSEYLNEDLDLLWMMTEVGLRQIHPLYYARSIVGDAFAEAGLGRDGGLSVYGRKVINRMNELGLLVDVAHASPLSILDICEETNSPVVFSHGACRAVKEHMRSINDEGIKAVAETDGVICLWAGYKYLKDPVAVRTVDDYVDHIEHVVNLVGVNHVGIGLDRSHREAFVNTRGVLMGWDQYQQELSDILPTIDYYKQDEPRGSAIGSDWDYFPITAGLLARGFSEQEIQKIIGENLLRVYKKVWN